MTYLDARRLDEFHPIISWVCIGRRLTVFCVVFVLSVFCIDASLAQEEQGQADSPRVFILDGTTLAEHRDRLRDADPTLVPAIERLIRQADAQLEAGPFSVMDKQATPPSGDRHDYMSIGPYWWPDPNTADGLPYVRRDGQTNPQRNAVGDNQRYKSMMRAVVTLSRAWYFTGEERYAERAALLLRTWYLDPATRMNPNMQYAQAIPGRVEGRGIGIVDASNQPTLIDAVGLLQDSDAWTDADQQGLVVWFDSLLNWLLTSSHGQAEAQTRNNHGTQYDVQVVSYALFVGRPEIAERVLQEVPARRIAAQIQADGSQPHELSRTRSWDYSCFNLKHFARLAALGRHVEIDLLQQEPGEPDIHTAMDYLLPCAMGHEVWRHPQIRELSAASLHEPLLLLLAGLDDTGRYAQAAQQLLDANDIDRLLYALP